MKSLQNVKASRLDHNALKTIKGGVADGFCLNPPLPGTYPPIEPSPSDPCSILNPDGTFNRTSGWCGSGFGGQGTFPE